MDERTEKFFEALNARISEAERDAAAREAKARKAGQFRQMGRMLQSLSNLYWTTRGAPASQGEVLKDNGDGADGGSYGERAAKERERLIKAHESLAKLRMAQDKTAADIRYRDSKRENEVRKTDADIGYIDNHQANENRKTDADIDKRNAETDHLVARGRVAQAQAGLKEAETAVKQQEARDLPQKQAQEAEVRKARAAQARAAAQRIKSQMKVKVKQKKY